MSTGLDVSTKIYGFRVDKIETEVSRMSIAGGDMTGEIEEVVEDPGKVDSETVVNEHTTEILAGFKKGHGKFLELPNSLVRPHFDDRVLNSMWSNLNSKMDGGGYAGYLVNNLTKNEQGVFVVSSYESTVRMDMDLENEKPISSSHDLLTDLPELKQLKAEYQKCIISSLLAKFRFEANLVF